MSHARNTNFQHEQFWSRLWSVLTKFIKEHIDIMTPVLTDVINALLMQGTFP